MVQLLARLGKAAGEFGGIPTRACVVGLYRLAVGVEQAPVEVEALRGMPAKSAETVGKTPVQRTGGINADQIESARGLVDLREHLGAVRRRSHIGQRALPRFALQHQVGIGLQLADRLAQLQQAIGEALAIGRRLAGQGDADIGMALVADQLEPGRGLPDLPGLAHARAIEANELGLFRAVPQREGFALAQRIAHIFGQRREQRLRIRHHAAPPKTSTCLNTQAGEAWPTRTTWLGSPLPQYGVPCTSKVLVSPTAARLRQKFAETPR